MNLYKDVVVKSEEPADPEHTVDRVQSISAAVFHLEQVSARRGLTFIYTLLAFIPFTAHKISIYFNFFIFSHISLDMSVDHRYIYPVDTGGLLMWHKALKSGYQTIIRIVQKTILIMKWHIFTEDLLFSVFIRDKQAILRVSLCPGELWGDFLFTPFSQSLILERAIWIIVAVIIITTSLLSLHICCKYTTVPPLCVLPLLSQVEQPLRNKKAVWHKLLSKQRKRAVVACFRMAPLYNLPRWVLLTSVTPVELI